jgi:nitroreductase/NAD-dependent dihydropyrimidine dehydrogenase PreA subunit
MRDPHEVLIDGGKCVGCGLCAKDCVSVNIRLDGGKAKVLSPDCLMCAHCLAICPENAVSITGFEDSPKPVEDGHTLNPEALLHALEARRSIRQFTGEGVTREALEKVIQAGRYTPTASNSQCVSYLIVQQRLGEVEKAAVGFLRKLQSLIVLVRPAYRGIVVDDHFLFKGAPAAVVVLAPNDVDGALAASSMALMAEAQGLGVLYSGFFTIAANHSPAVRKALGLKKGERAATTLVVGHPAVRYLRCAPKERPRVRAL